MVLDRNPLLDTIAQTIFDKKGFNILCLDVRGISSMTDYFVIAEGNVDRHVKALGLTIIEVMGEQGIRPLHTEGEMNSDWFVLDFGDIIVHLFVPELRDKYRIEQIWREAKIVNVKPALPQEKSLEL